MSHYIFNTADGNVWVMEHLRGELSEALRKFEHTSGKPLNVMPCDPHTLPPKDEYRNAWRLKGGSVDFDMDHAKAIHKDRIRAARAPMLAALDVEVSKALATSDAAKVAANETERQRLRDATAHPSIDGAKTIAELRRAWPL